MSKSLIESLSEGKTDSGRCPVGHFLRNLPEEERDAVIEAMRRCKSQEPEDKNFNFVWLSKTLEEGGKPYIKDTKFRRHMGGVCSCDGSTR